MSENYYFDGDPSTDSARRHLERVLKEPPHGHRKWPWVLAAVAGTAAWYFWPHNTTPADDERRAEEMSSE